MNNNFYNAFNGLDINLGVGANDLSGTKYRLINKNLTTSSFMPLPKISTPTYELELPSTGKKIKYRPFLVKEEKVLILALESQDPAQITNAIKQVLKDCVQTRGVKIEDLPSLILNTCS